MTRASSRFPALFALSIALRTARTAEGIGLRAFAEKLGVVPATLSAWELGDRRPSTEEVAHILGYLRMNPAEYGRIMRLRVQLDSPSYVEDHGTDTTGLQHTYEQLAVRSFEWAPHLVPELLQTPEYLVAIRQGQAMRPDDIDQEIFTRQVRQIDRNPSGHHTVLLGAAALTPQIASPQVLDAQLHLIGTMPQVSVRIVPASARVAGVVEPFTIYETEGKVFTVALRHQYNTVYLTEPGTVQRYRSTFKNLQREAVSYQPDNGV